MITKKALCFCALALGLGILQTAPAQAVPVITTVTGSVDLADGSNPFGLTTADAVTAVAAYDDSGIPAVGAFNLPLDADPAFSLTITLGSFTFVETDDDDFGGGFPRLEFLNGVLVGIEFERDGFALAGFTDLTVGAFNNATQWFLDDNVASAPLLEGTWDFANAVTVPVDIATNIPEPAAWLLFAAGLAGLIGVTRRPQRQVRRS
jgi:hypothetical protein